MQMLVLVLVLVCEVLPHLSNGKNTRLTRRISYGDSPERAQLNSQQSKQHRVGVDHIYLH